MTRMNMRMRVHTCALSLYIIARVQCVMPPKGGSERSELTPCNYYTYTMYNTFVYVLLQ